MTAQPVYLEDLPDAMATYRAYCAPIWAIHPDDRCYVCLRQYGVHDDPDEVPCRALQLPCRHHIGNQCLRILARSRLPMVCTLCKAPIPRRAGLPPNLDKLARQSWFLGEMAASHEVIGFSRNWGLKRDLLTARMAWSNFGVREGYELWKLYMLGPLYLSALAYAILLVGKLAFFVLDWASGETYFEVWFLCFELPATWTSVAYLFALLIHPLTRYWFEGAREAFPGFELWVNQHQDFNVVLILLQWLRVATLVLNWKLGLLLVALHFAFCGFLIAALIICGARWRSI